MSTDDFGNQELWYAQIYEQLPCGSERGFIAKLAHNAMEKSVPRIGTFSRKLSPGSINPANRILELGAGTGLHLNFISTLFSEYVVSDINPKSISQAKLKLNDDARPITFAVVDAEVTTYDDNEFDRVIATCVLLHLPNPEQALREWLRITKPGGLITIYLPSEPEFFVRFLRTIVTGRIAKNMGFDGFNLLMAREHINSAWRVETLLKYTYRKESIRSHRWPFRYSPLFFSIFTVFQISKSI